MMNVLFYDKNGNPINYRLPKAFAEGSNGTIHRINNDMCLKWFSEDSNYDQTALNIIMHLGLDNFYKIYQMLYDKSSQFCGYTMKYYESEEFDILTMPTEYTLSTLMALADSLNKLSAKKIYAIDLYEGNIIKNKNGIIVIDIDAYKYRPECEDKMIIDYNIESLYYLFYEIYLNALKNYHNTNSIDEETIKKLFIKQQSPDEVCKRLIKYKYPIDYVRKQR